MSDWVWRQMRLCEWGHAWVTVAWGWANTPREYECIRCGKRCRS